MPDEKDIDPQRPSGTDGEDSPPESPLTEREKERAREDKSFLPVIVKRTDEARRHPDDILQKAIEAGLEQLNRQTLSLALSSIAAGLILGFTAMAVGVMSSIVMELDWPKIVRLATAVVYPLGFVATLMSGTELFTEHTATAVYPILDRRSSLRRLFRLWAVVAGCNLVGALGGALLLTAADPVVKARTGYLEIGRHLVAYDTLPLLVSALLAGWLMALGAWLILSTPPTLSQVVSIYIVTFLIGLGGLHHSIAGAAEIFTAVLIGDQFTFLQAFRFIGLAILGNLVGGSLFVAGLNYAHIRQSRPAE